MMTKVFLPATRGLVVHRLKKRGAGQTSIAKLLGITQSAVSQILGFDERKYYKKLELLGISERDASLLVQTLCEEVVVNPVRATEVLYDFWLQLLSQGRFCEFHRRIYPQLANCEICIGRVFAGKMDEERTTVLKSLEKCVRTLESLRGFAKLIPQVGTNVVYSLDESSSINDVAGVLGRIVAVDDEVRSVGRPAFGGSHHLALVLLTARRFNRKIRAAANLRYSENMRKLLSRIRFTYIVVEPHTEVVTDEKVLEDLERVFRDSAVFPDAVLHGGGVGFEPITYLFAEDPDKLVEKIRKISNRFMMD